MKSKCLLELESFVDHGTMTVDGSSFFLEKKKYNLELTVDEKSSERILSLTNIRPGVDCGVRIVSMRIDGFMIDGGSHTRFVMIDNPYVENTTLKVNDINFNGELYFDLDWERIKWFPHYYSNKKIDFIYSNNVITCQGVEGCWEGDTVDHRKQYPNEPHDPDITIRNGDDIALGCSVTYGTAIDRSKIWPTLMGHKNLGVPALGIDGIYYNIQSILKHHRPGAITILFPNLDRRLIEFRSKGLFFRIPMTVSGLGNLYERNFYWISKDGLNKLKNETQRKIVDDIQCRYSREFLERISKIDCEFRVSSWNPETYEILPKYFDNVLPFFEQSDTAIDGVHPGVESHRIWVEKIKNHKI